MRRLSLKLLGSTTAMLLLGSMGAVAQTQMPDASGGVEVQGGGGGSVQGGGMQGGADVQGGAQTEGQDGSGMTRGGADAETRGSAEGRAQTRQGETGSRGEAGTRSRSSTQSESKSGDEAGTKSRSSTQGESDSDADTRTGGKEDTDTKERGSAETESKQRSGDAQESSGDRSRDRADDERGGDSKATAQFTSEHKTKVRTYFQKNKVSVEPVREVNISISVGTAVPSHIHLYTLPAAIFVGFPDDEDYLYFVYGDDIIVVDADTRLIVYVIPNVV